MELPAHLSVGQRQARPAQNTRGVFRACLEQKECHCDDGIDAQEEQDRVGHASVKRVIRTHV